MCVFSSASFDQHELVAFTEDAKSGLRAIIAVHNSSLGPAVGGCRMYPYANDADALEDVLRLSRGMTYKSALAGLPMGGGKAVIIGDPATLKTPELLQAMGRFIDQQGGKYITAEDSGTCVADLKIMSSQTKFVTGINEAQSFGGDPSPLTAYGVYCGIKSALQFARGDAQLKQVSVAVQGAGAVGRYLIKHLIDDGAQVYVADIKADNLRKAVELGATAMSTDEILAADVDILAPCAMGAVLNSQSIPKLRASIVAGAANNQLATIEDGALLQQRGILYAPDFVISAGGIIEIFHQNSGTMERSREHIAKIGDTLTQIFEQSTAQQLPTVRVAEQMAESLFEKAAVSNAA
ncbi:MAG: Glu/Leu/Phe/Val dehydrogenase [Gammaproteobacteria bacterium]|nr:Glu/Leu/Phe/Val dehydrogenase [Gammaproteobacteria bacterium]